MDFVAKSPAQMVVIEATVIRKNGYRENLGRISYWNRDLLKRLQWRWERRESGLFIAADPVAGLITLLPFALATLLVKNGEAITTNRIHGAGTEPLNIGWGTGAGTTTTSDTTLFTEVDPSGSASGSRLAGTGSQQTTTNTNDTYQVTGTKTATAALAITNAGLWDNVTIGSGNLYMKGDFATINLANGDSIAFTCKVQYQ